MRNKRNIHFSSIALLVLYAFALVPFVVFHQHHKHRVDFDAASSCEKAIYYGVDDQHEQHISSVQENCSLCDSHLTTAQLLFETTYAFFKAPIFHDNSVECESYHSVDPTHLFNKGPPFI